MRKECHFISLLTRVLLERTQLEMIAVAPIMILGAPKPATTRPTINIEEETAAPQINEPSSKFPKNVRNVHYYV